MHVHLVNTFFFVSGEVFTLQVILIHGNYNQMAPATAVKNIEHLLVITSDYGISTHNTFLVACAVLDLYLTEHGIE